MPNLQETKTEFEGVYRRRTPKSAELAEQALRALPGGDTRTSTYFAPYPTYFERGEGARLYDVDGNTYIDCLNNYTSLIHGNAFPPIVEAVQKQMLRGTGWGAPNSDQIRLAALMCERVPAVDLIRFTNSGTEGTMHAIRAARAFTGRDLIIKIIGGYHGTHDAVASGAGVPQATQDLTAQVPYNDLSALERAFAEHHGKIAALIMEPVMGSVGFIPADKAYLQAARKLTRGEGALLIFDEVMTFRLDYGGAQTMYDVRPDLTAFAKIIGGGLPVGAFGGRADIMELYDPRKVKVHHAGTFNGNPVTMAAGMAAMTHLTREKIAHVNQLGDMLRQGITDVLAEQGVQGQATGYGSFVGFHLTAQPVRDASGAQSVRPLLRELLHVGLLNRGVFTSRSGIANTSTVMTHDDITHLIQAFQDTLVELRPAIETECSDLLR
jgi:glutamate-1-semialdehyde 2,1-aminomutase